MTTIEDNAQLSASALSFLARQGSKPAQAPTPQVDAKPEPTQAARQGEAFRDAVRRLRVSVMSTTDKHRRAVEPWTEERLSAAANRMHSFFFGTDHPEIPKKDEETARFRFVFSCLFRGIEGLPGQSTDWYPDMLKRAQGILEQRSKSKPSAATKKVGASRVTDDGSVLQAV